MDRHDRDNLRFLLSCSPKQLKQWYNTASDEDLLYAGEILDRYAIYLEYEIRAEKIEQELATMPVLTEAQAVIAAIRG